MKSMGSVGWRAAGTTGADPSSCDPSARLHGLPPVVDARTVVLILGSFPGVASLRAAQYYAHPQNQFWRILQALWPHTLADDTLQDPGAGESSYARRCRWLLDRGLGVWDVYASCRRQGSLDANIQDAQLNDFAALRQGLPRLAGLAHNGGESFRHHRAVLQALGADAGATAFGSSLTTHRLPSSSPANASWSFERKCEAWRVVFAAHGLL